MKTRVTITQNGRELHIGVIYKIPSGKTVFSKTVKESKHLYRKSDAWGIDAQKYKELIEPNCDYILIHDLESGGDYKTRVKIFSKFGEYLHFKPHRAQIFLPRIYFRHFWGKMMLRDYCLAALNLIQQK